MEDTSLEDRSNARSFLDHAIVVCGGAIGGCQALFFVAVWAAHDIFVVLDIRWYLCGATVGALFGGIPGFFVHLLTGDLRYGRWIALSVAVVVGAFFTAVIAIALARGVSC